MHRPNLALFSIFFAILFAPAFPGCTPSLDTPTVPAPVGASTLRAPTLTLLPQATRVPRATQIPSTSGNLQPPDLGNLRQVMVEAINRDRGAAGLAPVQVNTLAAQVGQAHAEEMASNNYMSHWNLKGLGPDLRYSIAGGHDAVMENVFLSWQRYTNGTPVPITDWNRLIQEAETALMNSPGHRANILKPEHTHVGVGIAYNPATGEFRIAQEFVNHYLDLDPLPLSAAPGDSLSISGRLLPTAREPLINTGYEPAPRPMTIAQLSATSTYTSPAQNTDALNLTADAQGNFRGVVPIKRDAPPGVYHIRIWVMWNKERILASDVVVWVE